MVVVVQMRGELSTAIAGQTWSREEGLWYSTRAASSKVQALRAGSPDSGSGSGSGPGASSREGAPCAAVSQPAPSFPATAGPQDLDLRPSPGPWRWDEGAHAGSQSQLTPGGCQRCSWKPRPAGCNSRRRLTAADDGTGPGWTKW